MAMAGCNIQLANVVSNWQNSNRKLYIYGISQLAGRYPRRPSQPIPKPTWGVPDRRQPPRRPPEVTGFYSQGLLQLPPISILGIKKGVHLTHLRRLYSIC